MSPKSLRRVPNDRGQPRVPKELRDSLHDWGWHSISQYLQWAKTNVEAYMISNPEHKLRAEHITFLMYGFLAETNLAPTETQLVERREGGDVLWSYEKKQSIDNYMDGIVKLKEEEITRLRNRVAVLEQQLRVAQRSIGEP